MRGQPWPFASSVLSICRRAKREESSDEFDEDDAGSEDLDGESDLTRVGKASVNRGHVRVRVARRVEGIGGR